MKIGGSILAVLVFLLTVIPCCSFDDCEAEAGAGSQMELADDHSTNDCDSSCSPFLNCGGCAGFVLTSDDFEFTATPPSIPQIPTYYSARITGEVDLSIWQPPRKVFV